MCTPASPEKPCRIAGVGMDITDRRKLEEKVRHAAKLESLGVLAGGIAHDFNNLLTGILGNASLLREMVPGRPSSSGLLTNVIRASERAAQLSRQMLAYSGRGSSRLQPHRPFAAGARVRQLHRDHGFEKRCDPAESSRIRCPMVEGDEGQLQQVIMNLVVNAAEAIGETDGWVEVSTRLEQTARAARLRSASVAGTAAGEYVVLQVADNGSGMDDATRAKIFDPFFTTKFTGRGWDWRRCWASFAGTGAPYGSIRIAGVGTCFQVFFPALEEDRRAVLFIAFERQHSRAPARFWWWTTKRLSGWRRARFWRASATRFWKAKTAAKRCGFTSGIRAKSRWCCST